MKKKKTFLTRGAALSIFAVLALAGCGSPSSSSDPASSSSDPASTSSEPVVEPETDIKLNCAKTSIAVGESTTVSVANPNAGKSFVYISADEAVATVNNSGVVTGVGEGNAAIEVYQADDFTIKGSLVITVVGGASAGDQVKVLAVDAANAVKEFRLGDPFETTGLVVTVDGEAVDDYSTNPQAGETLSSVGTQTVYVSYPGCESVSYEVTVSPNENDYTLYNLVADMLEAATYTYTIDIDASVAMEDDTIVDGMSYTYQFGETAFYLETIAGDEVVTDTTYTYGYVNTTKGVMKYQALDDVVTPISYVSHSYISYKSVGVSDFQGMNENELAGVPLRETGGYYNVTNYNLMSYLASATRTNLSGVASTVRTIRGYVLANGFEFVLDCGTMGTITLRWSDIGTTVVPLIADYIAANGADIEIVTEVSTVADLFKANNFTRGISYTADGSTSSDGGVAYYHNDYLYFDYTDAYIAYAAANGTTLVDGGYYYYNNAVYSFQIVDGAVANATKYRDVEEGMTFAEASGLYPSALSMFGENIDMLAPLNITISGTTVATYGTAGDDLAEETFNLFGFASSTSAIAYQTGFIYRAGQTAATSTVTLYVGYTSLMATSVSYLGSTYEGFGTVSNTVIETYLASLTSGETGGNA